MTTCDETQGVIEDGGIAIKDGKIAWIGPMASLPGIPEDLAEEVQDVQGCCITPGLIDCHTHLVYAGNRAFEFQLRLEGVSYEEIAQKGGGIQSTVSETRNAPEEVLLQAALKRARALLANGVTTLEIKSGYGLDLETELEILQIAKRIESILPLTVQKTFLGAHALPPEYKNRADAYISLVCDEMLPAVVEENLADAVDVFCETIAFNLEQTERVFKKAQELGLRVKCHAEQLSDSGSAALAAKYQALSVDHLEHISEEGLQAIAASGTVAVLLPGAFYFLRETKLPPIEGLRKYGIPIALATDCNPGTSPILSLPLVMNMACTLFQMTPDEALMGVTAHAAKALGLEATHGSLVVGKVADFAVWDVGQPIELIYYMGNQPLWQLVKAGKTVRL
ncbi:MAG: imidazolonepropionase [Gammaproteobacteria bacterium]